MVPGSILSGVTGFFSDIFPSDCTMALGSTQPLVKMSTRNIPGGKRGRCVRLTTSPPSRAECHEIWKPKPYGTLWATSGLLRDSFTLHVYLPKKSGMPKLFVKFRSQLHSALIFICPSTFIPSSIHLWPRKEAHGPKRVRGTKKYCLPKVGVRNDPVQYRILQH